MKTQKKVIPEQTPSTELSKRYRRKSFHVFGVEILKPNKGDELHIKAQYIMNEKGIAVDSLLVGLEMNKYTKRKKSSLWYPIILAKGKSISGFLAEFKKVATKL